LRNRGQWDLSGAIQDDETYDLIVVGGGISGLAAAYFFIKMWDETFGCWSSTTTTILEGMLSGMSSSTTGGCWC